MGEEREFKFGKHMLENKNYNKCMVCLEEFKIGDRINLCPVQKVRKGWGNVVSIPIHVKCYWVEEDSE